MRETRFGIALEDVLVFDEDEKDFNPADHPRDPRTGRFIESGTVTDLIPRFEGTVESISADAAWDDLLTGVKATEQFDRDWSEWAKGLTEVEIGALERWRYTAGTLLVNEWLRHGRVHVDVEPVSALIRNEQRGRAMRSVEEMDSAIDKAPELPPSGLFLYRGISDTDDLFGDITTAKGKTFTDKGYVSASTEVASAEVYAVGGAWAERFRERAEAERTGGEPDPTKGSIIRMTVGAGVKGAWLRASGVEDVSAGNYEMLLERGLEMRVTNVQRLDMRYSDLDETWSEHGYLIDVEIGDTSKQWNPQTKRWEEAHHPRDPRTGRFIDKPGGGLPDLASLPGFGNRDTRQQRAILRQSATARKVRKRFPPGSRVRADVEGGAEGTVLRHVPSNNAQGGVLVVRWDNGTEGRHSPIALEKLEGPESPRRTAIPTVFAQHLPVKGEWHDEEMVGVLAEAHKRPGTWVNYARWEGSDEEMGLLADAHAREVNVKRLADGWTLQITFQDERTPFERTFRDDYDPEADVRVHGADYGDLTEDGVVTFLEEAADEPPLVWDDSLWVMKLHPGENFTLLPFGDQPYGQADLRVGNRVIPGGGVREVRKIVGRYLDDEDRVQVRIDYERNDEAAAIGKSGHHEWLDMRFTASDFKDGKFQERIVGHLRYQRTEAAEAQANSEHEQLMRHLRGLQPDLASVKGESPAARVRALRGVLDAQGGLLKGQQAMEHRNGVAWGRPNEGAQYQNKLIDAAGGEIQDEVNRRVGRLDNERLLELDREYDDLAGTLLAVDDQRMELVRQARADRYMARLRERDLLPWTIETIKYGGTITFDDEHPIRADDLDSSFTRSAIENRILSAVDSKSEVFTWDEYWALPDDVEKELAANPAFVELKDEGQRIRSRRTAIQDEKFFIAKDYYVRRRDAIFEIMRQVREFGGTSKHYPGTSKKARDLIDWSAQWFPKEWVDRHNSYPRDVYSSVVERRGHYQHAYHGKGNRGPLRSRLWISAGDDKTTTVRGERSYRPTAVHELGHRMEAVNPGVREAEWTFYVRRTTGAPDPQHSGRVSSRAMQQAFAWGEQEQLKRLKSIYPHHGYRSTEVTREDEFTHAYMGKAYDGAQPQSYFEILTMGMENLVTGDYDLEWKDPDMERFVLGLLAVG